MGYNHEPVQPVFYWAITVAQGKSAIFFSTKNEWRIVELADTDVESLNLEEQNLEMPKDDELGDRLLVTFAVDQGG